MPGGLAHRGWTETLSEGETEVRKRWARLSKAHFAKESQN